ncbi:MAG: site-2 protease family protein [Terriglobales bacterium]
MTLQQLNILFQLIVFLFAISVHESAHAWMASRCGDPTARMLGRVSLNPIRHIDPFGTVLLPLIAVLTHIPMLGWAKPTPVDPRNFKNPVRDDIFTTLAGPISNFTLACIAVVFLGAIAATSHLGSPIIQNILFTYPNHLDALAGQTNSVLLPLSLLAYDLMFINVVLGVFNLIPIPPLDGSHVLRHFLPEGARKTYDTIGWFGLLILVYFGGGLIGRLIYPVLGVFNSLLNSISAS